MGVYPISCPVCQKLQVWFSGSTDQRCYECIEKDNEVDKNKSLFTEVKTKLEELNALSFALRQLILELEKHVIE